MDRFHELRVFIAVAECGGFARAATLLRLSPPAVTRVIASLEQRLAAQLFVRTTRVVRLTEPGQRFLERARRVLADLDGAEKELSGESGIPSGHLAITAPVVMGRIVLSAIMTEFLQSFSRVTAKVTLLDRTANLVEEGFDVALRVGQLPDSSLIARPVGEIRRIVVASPSYIAKRGQPRVPADLKTHATIAVAGLSAATEWSFGRGRSATRVTLAPRFEINDAAAAIAAAEAGEGIATVLSYMVAREVRDRRLVPVLEEFAPAPIPVQIVFPASRLVAPNIRAFVDFTAPRLRDALQDLAISTPRAMAGRKPP